VQELASFVKALIGAGEWAIRSRAQVLAAAERVDEIGVLPGVRPHP
jgi:hypothetical protein